MPDRHYGRKPSPKDERDWPLSRLTAMVVAGAAVPITWDTEVPPLDQGATPRCVGFGGAGWIATDEKLVKGDVTVTNVLGDSLYARCKELDGDNEDGTYVRTLAKVLKQMGLIDAYAFGASHDVAPWIENCGPVLIGSRWDYDMEDPDYQGFVHPGGGVAGGHCTFLRGAYLSVGSVVNALMGRNSWGQDWGILGDYYITQADLDDILSGDGEVLMAVKFVTPAPPAPTPTPTPDAKGCLTSALALLGAFHGNSKKVKQATALIKKALSEL